MTVGPSLDLRADRVAAWATGIGTGVATFMIAWLALSRIADQVSAPPTGPVVAMAASVVIGVLVSVIQGRRLSRRFPVSEPESALAECLSGHVEAGGSIYQMATDDDQGVNGHE